uniref:Uncharacterized protein n=1 Tax=Anopheles atroparvus TaxID=41427 RepID=A0A182IST8_ANOAO
MTSAFYRNCRQAVSPSRVRMAPASPRCSRAATRVAPLHASSLQMEQDSILTPRCSFALPYAIWQGSVLPPSSWHPRKVIVSPFSAEGPKSERKLSRKGSLW